MLFVFDEIFSEEPQETVSQKENLPVIRPIVRAKRATEDELSAVIDQLAISARIVTAITLQNGLIEGSIPSDKALAELMNAGPVDFAELEKFKKKNVDGIIGKLKGLQLTGSQPAELKDFEVTIAVLNTWKRMYAEVGDLNDFQLANDYFAKVQNLQNVNLDTQMIINVQNSIVALMGDLTTTLNLPDNIDPADYDQYLIPFLQIRKKNLLLEQFLQKLDGWIASLKKLKPLANHEFTITSPQIKFFRLLNAYEHKKKFINGATTSALSDVVSMISVVSTALANSDADVKELQTLVHLVTSRALASVASRNFTSGFVNGHSDLKKVPADARSTLMNSLTSRLDQKTLEDGLRPLKVLSDKTDKLEMSWKTLSQTGSVSAAQKVQAMSEKFGSIKSVAPVAANETAEISKCGYQQGIFTNVLFNKATLLKTSTILGATLQNADRKVSNLRKSPLLADLTNLVKIKDFIPFSNDPKASEVPAVVTKFKTFKDTQKYIDTLNKLKPLVETMASEFKNADVNTMIKNMAAGLNEVQAFVADSEAVKLIQYFNSLRGVNEIESVAESVKLIQEIRDFQKDSQLVQQISTMAGVIESSLPELKALGSAPNTTRSNQSPETKLLMQLKSLGNEAKNFGDAVTALTMVKKVLEKKEKLEQFIIDGWSVEDEIGKLTDVSMKMELEEDWGDFGKTASEISSLLANLKQGTNQLVIPEASKFADYGPVFTAFSGLKDVNLRTEKRKKALETLVAQNQGLGGVKKLFDELTSLDLQFSRFSTPLSGMPGTLTNLDLAFAQYSGPKSSSTKKPNAPSLQPGPQNSSAAAPAVTVLITSAPSSGFPIWIGIVAGFASCVVVISSCLGVWLFRKDLAKREKKREQAEMERIARENFERTLAELNNAQYQKELNEKLREEERQRQMKKRRIRVDPNKKVVPSTKTMIACEELLADYPNRPSNFFRRYAWVPPRVEKIKVVGDTAALPEARHQLFDGFLQNHHKQQLEKLERENVTNNAFKELNQLNHKYLGKDKTLMARWYDFHSESLQDQERHPVPWPNRVRDAKANYVDATQPMNKASEKDWFDLNIIKYPLAGSAYAAQTPMAGNIRGKKDTREAFWKFALNKKCVHIVELTGGDEDFVYFSDTEPMVFGCVKVRVLVTEKTDFAQHRVIDVRDSNPDENNAWYLNHWKLDGWSEDEILYNTYRMNQLIEIHKQIRPADTAKTMPYFVLSKNGRGRAGTFIGMEFICQSLVDLDNVKPSLWTILQEMRSKRYGLVSNGWQLYFMLIAGCWYFREVFPNIKNAFYRNHLEDNFAALLEYQRKGGEQNKKDKIAFKKYHKEHLAGGPTLQEAETQEDSQRVLELEPTQIVEEEKAS